MNINTNFHDISYGAAGLGLRYCWVYMSNSYCSCHGEKMTFNLYY